MKQYLDLLKDVLENGVEKGDRTGTGTLSVFGRQMRFNLQDGFPLVTTKKVHLRSIIHELLWFLKGDTNNNSLLEHNVHIWDEWVGENGDLGPIYGKQWRSWTGKVISADVHVDAGVVNVERQNHDQIAELIEGLKKKPFSRRHIVSAWNVEDLPDESISPQENVAQGRMALAPCHCLFQFYVSALNQNEIAAMIDARGLTEEFTMASIDALDRDMKGEKGAAVDYLPAFLDKHGIPKYKLSCQLYQR